MAFKVLFSRGMLIPNLSQIIKEMSPGAKTKNVFKIKAHLIVIELKVRTSEVQVIKGETGRGNGRNSAFRVHVTARTNTISPQNIQKNEAK